MTKGFDRAKQLGVAVHSDEMVIPFGEERWIIAHRHGFRPCPWAYQVARFCRFRPGDKVADLGCGAGALMVAAHALCPDLEKLVGVELDGEVADQSRRTLAMNNCVHGMVVRADIRSIPLRPEFDIVMMNPPFIHLIGVGKALTSGGRGQRMLFMVVSTILCTQVDTS